MEGWTVSLEDHMRTTTDAPHVHVFQYPQPIPGEDYLLGVCVCGEVRRARAKMPETDAWGSPMTPERREQVRRRAESAARGSAAKRHPWKGRE
jgi:hypothetical protein